MNCRIKFPNKEEERKAIEILEKSGDDFDWDSGDRMMITIDGLETLEKYDVDYDELV